MLERDARQDSVPAGGTRELRCARHRFQGLRRLLARDSDGGKTECQLRMVA